MFDQTKNSLFRKLAASLWHNQGDPSVYGFVELDVTDLKNGSAQLLSLVVKSLSETMQANPELKLMIRWGMITERQDNCISVMVNIPDFKKDLSVLNIYNGDQLSVNEIEQQIANKALLVRNRQDPHLGPILSLIAVLPKFLLKFFLKLYTFLIYEIQLPIKSRYLPKRPFGSVIISNVGSLGIKKALLPLVPLARPAMMVSLGKVEEEVKVFNGQVAIRKIAHLGITFDHRLFDGSHAAKMLGDFEKSFYGSITI